MDAFFHHMADAGLAGQRDAGIVQHGHKRLIPIFLPSQPVDRHQNRGARPCRIHDQRQMVHMRRAIAKHPDTDHRVISPRIQGPARLIFSPGSGP